MRDIRNNHILLCMFWRFTKKRKYNDMNSDSDNDDNTEKSQQNNIYVTNSHIHFNCDITAESMFLLKKELLKLDKQLRSKAVLEDNDQQPIYLHLTTNGGCIHSALSVIDCMENLQTPVYTIIDGYVASAGTLISISGNKRFITKNSYVLIHQMSSGFSGKLDYLEDKYKNCKKVDKHILEIYKQKTKIPKSKLVEIIKKELEYNATEAVKLGIADEIYSKK